MVGMEHDLWLALLAPGAAGGARRAARQLLQSGRSHLLTLVEQLPATDRQHASEEAARLRESGVVALLCDDPRYPDRLRRFSGAPPALFCRGPLELLDSPAIGVCGSRNASAEGLRAAGACADAAAGGGVVVVSGYAKGVDTESHLAALKAGGGTVAVLAEGIDHFRVKPPYRALPSSALDRILVLSQYPPGQRWTVGAAMTRNNVIVGLGELLLVVEAGDTGGTIRAGEVAIRGDRPVLVLDTGDGASPGNEKLIVAGARRVTDREQFAREIGRLRMDRVPQLPLE